MRVRYITGDTGTALDLPLFFDSVEEDVLLVGAKIEIYRWGDYKGGRLIDVIVWKK